MRNHADIDRWMTLLEDVSAATGQLAIELAQAHMPRPAAKAEAALAALKRLSWSLQEQQASGPKQAGHEAILTLSCTE